jgi:DNA-binding LacI/PurR family transcriptional regulator
MAQGVAEIAYANGFSVLLCDCGEKPERELEMLNVLDEKRVDGVIIAAPRVDSRLLIPAMAVHQNTVMINRQLSERCPPNMIGSIVSDDEEGGRKITELLLKHGHKTVGFLAGPKASYCSKRRMSGYQDVLSQAGVPLDPEIIHFCSPTVKGGHEATCQLLGQRPELTCLFCYNDLVAIGALQACTELGRRVPADLAIVGYDDIPMASWVNPQLTTCRVVFEEMGRLAMQLLVNYLGKCPEGCQNFVLQPTIIQRASAP